MKRQSICFLLFLLLALAQAASGALAQQDAVTVDEYVDWLTGYRSRLDEEKGDVTISDEAPSVALSSGDVITPFGLDEAGADRDARVDQVLMRMHAYDALKAQEMLAQFEVSLRAFQMLQPNPIRRLFEWLMDLLERIMPEIRIVGDGPITPWMLELIGWLLAGVGITSLVFLLGHWLSGSLAGLMDNVALRRRDERLPTADEAREQASHSASTGDYRQALRQLYLAALLHLHERGILRYEEHRTNRELLAQIQHDSELSAALDPVIGTFEPFWYGVRQPDQESFERYRAQVDRLMQWTTPERSF